MNLPHSTKGGYTHVENLIISVVGLVASLSSILFAFLAGGVVMNVMKDELPLDGSGNAPAFALGAVAYAALLLAV